MAWQLLFSSDIGLASLFVIVFVVGMAIWFSRYFKRKMAEDEKKAAASASGEQVPRRH